MNTEGWAYGEGSAQVPPEDRLLPGRTAAVRQLGRRTVDRNTTAHAADRAHDRSRCAVVQPVGQPCIHGVKQRPTRRPSAAWKRATTCFQGSAHAACTRRLPLSVRPRLLTEKRLSRLREGADVRGRRYAVASGCSIIRSGKRTPSLQALGCACGVGLVVLLVALTAFIGAKQQLLWQCQRSRGQMPTRTSRW